MQKVISSHQNWITDLAPRLTIGMWHPRFIPSAKKTFHYSKLSYIGDNLKEAQEDFWDHVDVFSIDFPALATAEGRW
jgi:phosphatidylglycerol phospholipase C